MKTITSPALYAPPVERERIAPTPDAVVTARVRLVGRIVAVTLCALHAYANRHLINPDAISYLDVASAYARGDFANAVNSYWSPLYSWLLAGANAILRPTPYWECAVAHGVSVLTFFAALMAFEWLLSELFAARAEKREAMRESWHDLLPDWLVAGVSYSLFAVVSRRLITVSQLTPDMLVAAGAFAATAILLRLARMQSPGLAALLGAVLGVSYLGKTVMFPLAFVYFAVLMAITWRRGMLEFSCAWLTWLPAVVPWIVVMSLVTDQPGFGTSGALNYLWNINGLATPERADRKESNGFELITGETLASDCGQESPSEKATYPLWYAPARHNYAWGAADMHFNLRGQLAAIGKVSAFYYTLFAEKLLPFTAAIGVLTAFAFFARRGSSRAWLGRWLRDLAGLTPLLAPALSGLAMYAVVGHAEGRLVGPFVVLLGLTLLAAIRLPHPRQVAVRPIGAAFLAFLSLLLAGNLAFDAGKAIAAAKSGEGTHAHPHWRIAQELRTLGVQPGDGVASVGFTYNAYWARLAGCPCVAEVPLGKATRFWTAPPAERTQALTAMRLAGARAVVCDNAPPQTPGWRRVEGTTFAIRLLPND